MVDPLDITPIEEDVRADAKVRKMCESCNRRLSRYLYILKSVLYGIFHLCEDCKKDFDCSETHIEEVRTTFVEKNASTWQVLEDPFR